MFLLRSPSVRHTARRHNSVYVHFHGQNTMLASAFANMSLHGSCQASFASGQRLQQRHPLRLCGPTPFSVEAAHKKGGGSTKNGRDSKSKRRGVKVYGGQPIKAGGIIVRQLGTKVCYACTLIHKAQHNRIQWYLLVASQPFCVHSFILASVLA